jgi:hypothetical protein
MCAVSATQNMPKRFTAAEDGVVGRHVDISAAIGVHERVFLCSERTQMVGTGRPGRDHRNG